jgi:hypothetical protein
MEWIVGVIAIAVALIVIGWTAPASQSCSPLDKMVGAHDAGRDLLTRTGD